jgi:hypothetical protein
LVGLVRLVGLEGLVVGLEGLVVGLGGVWWGWWGWWGWWWWGWWGSEAKRRRGEEAKRRRGEEAKRRRASVPPPAPSLTPRRAAPRRAAPLRPSRHRDTHLSREEGEAEPDGDRGEHAATDQRRSARSRLRPLLSLRRPGEGGRARRGRGVRRGAATQQINGWSECVPTAVRGALRTLVPTRLTCSIPPNAGF